MHATETWNAASPLLHCGSAVVMARPAELSAVSKQTLDLDELLLLDEDGHSVVMAPSAVVVPMIVTGAVAGPGIAIDRRASSPRLASALYFVPGSGRKRFGAAADHPRDDDGASTSGELGMGMGMGMGMLRCWRTHGQARIQRRVWIASRAAADGHGETDPSSADDDPGIRAAVDEGQRLLALQKELLEQVTERKKLLNTLTQDFGASKEKTSPFQNSGEASPGRVPGIGAWPPQSIRTPQASPAPPPPLLVPDARVAPPEPRVVSSKDDDSSTESPLVKKISEKPPPLAGVNVMNVIIVAAECAPWSKTGGLGDVVGALPKALARRGHRVMAVAPRYKNYAEAWETGVRKVYNVAGEDIEVGYFHAYIDGVDFVFIDSPVYHSWAQDIYGGSREDVLTRMILLCKAAVEIPWHVPCGGVCYGDGNLVFIANDWHTALLPVYLQAFYRDNQLMQYTRSVLVIHNIAHQGRGPLSDFGRLGLPEHFREKFALYDPIGGEHMNVFMAGIRTAHRVIAVSHGYARECQMQEGGWGLDGVIRDNSWKLKGVVNGIDDAEWNPEVDKCLVGDGYKQYSSASLESGKGACKSALQKELGLPVRADVPLLGFIGRLDYQKGVDIIADAVPWMMQQDLQLVLLGTGRSDLEDMLRSFEAKHRDKVRGWVGFSVKMAHRITAGVDILLMPSRFEPCGLNQLYAMRYGTVPVVHAVGGLRDTVTPFDPFSDKGLGWMFERPEAQAMIHAIGNAMWTFKDYKESWKGIQLRGMKQDLSWDHAAEQYEEVLVGAKFQW